MKRGNFAFRTDIGKVRKTNEDNAVVLINSGGAVFMVICDGMGGHQKGDIASKRAVDYLIAAFNEKSNFFTMATAKLWLTYHIKQINRAIYSESQKIGPGQMMGTTLTAVLMVDNQIAIANVGDSRAYILRRNGLEQVTEDQTYVNYLVRTNKITKEEAKTHPQKHVLLNAIGLNLNVNVDLQVLPYNDEKVVLCTDGLYNLVSYQEFISILVSSDSVDQKCDSLVNIANANGGIDNIAIAIWEPEK